MAFRKEIEDSTVSDMLNAAGVTSAFMLLYESIHCRISLIPWHNSGKLVKRIFASEC